MRRLKFAFAPSIQRAVSITVAFGIGICLLFGFVYWQAGHTLARNVDSALRLERDALVALPRGELMAEMADTLARDLRGNRVEGLFTLDGQALFGNIQNLPPLLRGDSEPHDETVTRTTREGSREETVRMTSRLLPDNTILAVARSEYEIHEIGEILARSLVLGLVPALLFSVLAGILLGARANRRIEEVSETTRRIVTGGLKERLPVRDVDDPFDRLSGVVNNMLDDIQRLLHQIADVGDDIAHDLRTPLTRVRATLERGRDNAQSLEEMRMVVDRGISGLDQSLSIITALLRIAEIEHSQRFVGFSDLAAAELLDEIVELYAPIAEDRGIALFIANLDRSVVLRGDRDLLFEAMANLVDNALKFTPAGGRIELALERRGQDIVLRVSDTGPGISESDREMVTRRFYRSERSRNAPGVGLGLSLVSAIAKLHGFDFVIGTRPGCTVELIAASPGSERQQNGASPANFVRDVHGPE